MQGKSVKVSFGLNFVIVVFKRINYQFSSFRIALEDREDSDKLHLICNLEVVT